MKSTVIILGTSRKNGNTENLVYKLNQKLNCEIINLREYKISEFDYEHNNYSDDFLKIIKDIIEKYEHLVFVTPVYWYSMSGIMKTFFDRLTDLLTIEKEIGRKLRGKKVSVLTSSIGDNMENNFWLPFENTFKYLGMEFILKQHFIESDITDKQIEQLYNILK